MHKFKVKKIKVPIAITSNNQPLFTAMPELDFNTSNETITNLQQESIYVNELGNILKNILNKSGYRIWIILDRLDEVFLFQRYSKVEFLGLRGLLRAYESFDIGKGNELLRIKIFLRDDIKEFITDSKVYKRYFPGKIIPSLTATHIFAKQSPTLNWNEDEIQQLILNRLLLNVKLQEYLGIPETYKGLTKRRIEEKLKEELRIPKKRFEYWNKIFPEKISSPTSLTWIFNHLKDSNGIVTPRSVIDMLEAAINYQKKRIQSNWEDYSNILPLEAVKEGISIASKNKLENDIYVEFPNEQRYIKRLEKEGNFKLNKKQLRRMYGNKFLDIAERLRRIGILKYVKLSDEYMVVHLFRPALNISYRY